MLSYGYDTFGESNKNNGLPKFFSKSANGDWVRTNSKVKWKLIQQCPKMPVITNVKVTINFPSTEEVSLPNMN